MRHISASHVANGAAFIAKWVRDSMMASNFLMLELAGALAEYVATSRDKSEFMRASVEPD
jgi:hypothetical protein